MRRRPRHVRHAASFVAVAAVAVVAAGAAVAWQPSEPRSQQPRSKRPAVVEITISLTPEVEPSALPSPTRSPTASPTPPLDDLTLAFEQRFTTVPGAPDWRTGFAAPATAGDVTAAPDGLRLNAYGASYFWTERTDDVKAATVGLRFEGDGGGDSTGAALVFSKLTGPNQAGPTGVFSNSVHIGIRRSLVNVAITDGHQLHSIGKVPLSLRVGADYTVTVVRSGPDELTVWVPEAGVEQTVESSEVSDYWGSTVGVEHYQPEGMPPGPRPVLVGVEVYR